MQAQPAAKAAETGISLISAAYIIIYIYFDRDDKLSHIGSLPQRYRYCCHTRYLRTSPVSVRIDTSYS